jgi:hypothetical protein
LFIKREEAENFDNMRRVIERVRQRMTSMTKKESQAIVALNTPKRDEFVDLTEPIAEGNS